MDPPQEKSSKTATARNDMSYLFVLYYFLCSSSVSYIFVWYQDMILVYKVYI